MGDEHLTHNNGRPENRQARHEMREAAGDAKREASRRANTGMNATAEKLRKVQRALGEATRSLEEQGEERLADYARQAAEQVGRSAEYLRDEEPERLARDVRDSAREHPAVFFGGMLAAGIAAGRFLGASDEDEHETRARPYEYGREAAYT